MVPDLTIGRGKSNGALPATYPGLKSTKAFLHSEFGPQNLAVGGSDAHLHMVDGSFLLASSMPNRGRRIQETDISSFSPRSQVYYD